MTSETLLAAPRVLDTSDSTPPSESELEEASPSVKGEAADASSGPQVLSPGEWARVVCGFDAPFGFDGMPTVMS